MGVSGGYAGRVFLRGREGFFWVDVCVLVLVGLRVTVSVHLSGSLNFTWESCVSLYVNCTLLKKRDCVYTGRNAGGLYLLPSHKGNFRKEFPMRDCQFLK